MRLRQESAAAYEKADAALNQVWRLLRKELSKKQKRVLLAGQRAWLKYRDATCNFWLVDAGTAAIPLHRFCLTEMTDARTAELVDMAINPYTGEAPKWTERFQKKPDRR